MCPPPFFFVTSEQLSFISFVKHLQVTLSYSINFFLPLAADTLSLDWLSLLVHPQLHSSLCGLLVRIAVLLRLGSRSRDALQRLCDTSSLQKNSQELCCLLAQNGVHLPPALTAAATADAQQTVWLGKLLFFSKSFGNARTPCSTRGWNFLFISGASESSLCVELHLLMLQYSNDLAACRSYVMDQCLRLATSIITVH